MLNMSSRIKVLSIITGLSTGGAEMMLHKVIRKINHERFAFHVISLTGRGELAEAIEEVGVPVQCCEMRSGNVTIAQLRRLTKQIASLGPDIVQTWLYHADLVGGLAARLAGNNRIIWNIRHNNNDRAMNKRHTLITMRLNSIFSWWLPETIVCNSLSAVAFHKRAGYNPNRFQIIPNGFDLEVFRPDSDARESVREELGIPADATLVGLVARFDPLKNHKMFLAAAAEVKEQAPGTYFVLVGQDVDSQNNVMTEMIHERGLGERVRLLGRRTDIARLTASLDAAVCCSWAESFPNAIGEAMACGIPCVATDVGDCATIVGDGKWIVAPGDSHRLAQKLLALLDMGRTGRELLGREGRQRISEQYSIERIVASYEELYSAKVTKNA